MYTLVRRFIKTGIAFLFLGLVLGLWMLVRRELFGVWPNPYLVSAHAHVVLVGFVMFLILGVALWMFPRAARDDERYRPVLAELAYWLLLVGTVSRFVAEAARAGSVASVLGWIVVIGATGQVAGLAVYFWTMWTRIRPSGSQLREAKGERF
ncbi:MAG TPA: cbb3-type cytochrome c oxidase subunit I [Gemmatimonadota bacterium]|nr:cbb3-type cytochrome c oxidase subunit I [Gemmatimonadota bacterium]